MQRKTLHKTIPNITLQKTKVHNSILMFRDQVQMKKIIQRKLIKEINSSIAVGRFNLLYQEHRILLWFNHQSNTEISYEDAACCKQINSNCLTLRYILVKKLSRKWWKSHRVLQTQMQQTNSPQKLQCLQYSYCSC